MEREEFLAELNKLTQEAGYSCDPIVQRAAFVLQCVHRIVGSGRITFVEELITKTDRVSTKLHAVLAKEKNNRNGVADFFRQLFRH